MAILVKNRSSIPECSSENKSFIDDRVLETNTNIGVIRTAIMDFDSTVKSSSNVKIKDLKKATSFPIEDIFKLLANNPDCKYLRVYNGFDSEGNYVTYLAPISATFDTYVTEDSSDSSIISVSCCHCNPCTKDKILNP